MLAHLIAGNSVTPQHLRGSSGGEHAEAEVGEPFDGEHQRALVPVRDRYEHRALGGQRAVCSGLALGEGAAEVVVDAHHLAGRLHFWTEERVDVGAVGLAEAVEREHRLLHRDRCVARCGGAVSRRREHTLFTQLVDAGAEHAGDFPSRAVTLPRNSVKVTAPGSVIDSYGVLSDLLASSDPATVQVASGSTTVRFAGSPTSRGLPWSGSPTMRAGFSLITRATSRQLSNPGRTIVSTTTDSAVCSPSMSCIKPVAIRAENQFLNAGRVAVPTFVAVG